MSNLTPTEKQPLLEKPPAITIRRVQPSDAPAILTIITNSIDQPSSTASLDTPPTLSSLQSIIKSTTNTLELIWDVALDVTAGKVIGLMNLGPFTAKPPGARSCFDKTASLQVVTPGEWILGSELQERVQRALIEHAVKICNERADEIRFRTMVFDKLVRRGDDEDGQKLKLRNFEDAGFKLVGRLEGVAEKEGELLDQVFLQYTPPSRTEDWEGSEKKQ